LAKTVHGGNVSYYKFILPSFQITARQVNSKAALTISYNFNTPSFKKFHTKEAEGKAALRTAKAALKYTTTELRSCSSCSCWTSQLCSADINGLYFDDGSVYIYTVSNVTTDRKSRFAKRNHRPAAAMTATA